jgi:hypothetical protein
VVELGGQIETLPQPNLHSPEDRRVNRTESDFIVEDIRFLGLDLAFRGGWLIAASDPREDSQWPPSITGDD